MPGPRLRPYALALAFCLLATLALPIAASASPGALTGPEKIAQLTLHGSHGYQVKLSGAVEGPHSTVSLAVTRGSSSAGYSVPATITPTAIEASFGHLGKVSLRLQGSGRVQRVKVPKKCRRKGEPAVAEARLGTFVGTFRFRGEHDYTHVLAHRAKGAVGESPAFLLAGDNAKYVCFGPAPEAPQLPQPKRAAVAASASRGGIINFFAIGQPAPATPSAAASAGSDLEAEGDIFLALIAERHGKMSISRTVVSVGPPADFLFDNALNTATVSPPAPFSGIAAFQRGPDGSASWTGSLAVSFPGRGPVALAGPAFKASLQAE